MSERLFPLRLSLKIPATKELLTQFAEVQIWIKALMKMSELHGFLIEWRDINHRQLGRNQIPIAIVIPSSQAALQWLGKLKDQALFRQSTALLMDNFPDLRPWIIKNPHQLMKISNELKKLMAILHWRLANPKPDIYMRQLSLPGVDTKFIEQHKKVLMDWFELELPPDHINHDKKGINHFALRYGFKEKPDQIRFRILDERLLLNGLSDLMISVEEFSQLQLKPDTVFVTENDINALAFPSYPNAIVIFGRGYGFEGFAHIQWLKSQRIRYWGDIDTHGFAILNQFRMTFPQTESLLMDEETLFAHRDHWSKELKPSRAELSYLNPKELLLYQGLKSNQFGMGVRLEQEYINYEFLLKRIIDSEN